MKSRIVVAAVFVWGCGEVQSEGASQTGTAREELVGGHAAIPSELPATVTISGSFDGLTVSCSATKVGTRHFLLASHCVTNGLTGALTPPFTAGGHLAMLANSDGMRSRGLTVAQTSLPSVHYYVQPPVTGAPDAAIIRVIEDTPEIPLAVIDANPLQPGAAVIKTGYGCEEVLGPARLKLHPTMVRSPALLQPYYSPTVATALAGSFQSTPRQHHDATTAQLCPGDSGGPLYLDAQPELLVVGVNCCAGYTGDAHTRLDSASTYGIDAWARTAGARVRYPSLATPWGGTPAPATLGVEAENFDLGGAGVSHLDLTPGNQGGAYRSDDADISALAEASNGHYVVAQAGEWLHYTLTAELGGDYTLELRVSAPVASADALRVELDGQDESGPVPLTATYDWESVVVPRLALTPGKNLLRLRATGSDVAIDSLRFTTLPLPCDDGVKNGAEVNVDCGGDRCGGCAEGLSCTNDHDCAGNYCLEGQCSNAIRPSRIDAGTYFACGLFSDSKLRCWGRNDQGQLGAGPGDDVGDEPGELTSSLQTVDLPANVVSFALGDSHACAVLANGSVYCWGANQQGQLGLGDTAARSTPTIVDLGGTAAEVSLGYEFSCARLASGSVKCWGRNAAGELGIGSNQAVGDAPGEMGAQLHAVNLPAAARSISAGGRHACALLVGSELRCWGSAFSGQLGYGVSVGLAYGDSSTELTPQVAALGSFTVSAVAAGGDHTCARNLQGAVKCWGNNAWGQLGYGDGAQRGTTAASMGDNLPVVPLPFPVSRLDARVHSSCVTNLGGEVRCWGSGGGVAGQPALVGLGNFGDAPGEVADLPPIALGDTTNTRAFAITTGGFFACALLGDGTTKCWGQNTHGQLGLGDTAVRGDDISDMGNSLPRLLFP
jgi:alpha-tubulin suppressor-like RCC1 family protein